jgi:hypothetical protein
MLVPKGRTLPLIKQIASMQQASEANMKYAGLPNSCVRATVYDIEDPENRGRVRVLFDDFNQNIPQVLNAGNDSKERISDGTPQLSHWIDVSPSFKGRQPKGMVGKRCNIVISNRQFQYAVLGDVLYDPQMLTDKAGKEYKQPNNSSMTRMPIYEAGDLPPACEENHGCSVIEKGGPYSDDWLCICLKRSGKYLWVRHIDMQHGHAGANDTTSYSDTGGDKPFPAKAVTNWDFTFPTSAAEMPKYSAYGTKPTGNPLGDKVQWFPPPMSDLLPLPTVPPSVTNQDQALAFIREVDGFAATIPGQIGQAVSSVIPSASSVLPFKGFSKDFDTMYKNLADFAKSQLSSLTGINL